MRLTKENAAEIAARMSAALTGGVRSITKINDEKQKTRFDENGLDKKGWCGDAAKQELPVKIFDGVTLLLLWSTAGYSYSVGTDAAIEFVGENEVIFKHFSASGNFLVWQFIGGQDE